MEKEKNVESIMEKVEDSMVFSPIFKYLDGRYKNGDYIIRVSFSIKNSIVRVIKEVCVIGNVIQIDNNNRTVDYIDDDNDYMVGNNLVKIGLVYSFMKDKEIHPRKFYPIRAFSFRPLVQSNMINIYVPISKDRILRDGAIHIPTVNSIIDEDIICYMKACFNDYIKHRTDGMILEVARLKSVNDSFQNIN